MFWVLQRKSGQTQEEKFLFILWANSQGLENLRKRQHKEYFQGDPINEWKHSDFVHLSNLNTALFPGLELIWKVPCKYDNIVRGRLTVLCELLKVHN